MRGFLESSQPVIRNPEISSALAELRLCDIGFNSVDGMFRGSYHGKHGHAGDMELVLERARSLGVESILCTAADTKAIRKTYQFCKDHHGRPVRLMSTAGVHPTHCKEFQHGAPAVISSLRGLINEGLREGVVAAIGECGLDYDRLFMCPKELQHVGFLAQLELAKEYSLPLFLHDRNTSGDFMRIMREHLPQLPAGGVVHSFTGSTEDMLAYCAMGLYISLNGCSLRTEEGLRTAAAVPEHLLLLETDAPWCAVKATHVSAKYVTTSLPAVRKERFVAGSMVKDRNEPCTMVHVLEIVAKVRGVGVQQLADSVIANTYRLFPALGLEQQIS